MERCSGLYANEHTGAMRDCRVELKIQVKIQMERIVPNDPQTMEIKAKLTDRQYLNAKKAGRALILYIFAKSWFE